MSSILRWTGIGGLLAFGVLIGPDAAHAQFSFGYTRFGYNSNNPYLAAQQYGQNLAAARAAIIAGVAAPAYSPPIYVNPYVATPFVPPAAAYVPPAAPLYNPYTAFNPYMGAGVNPYTPAASGYAGSNPYAPVGSAGAGTSNPYAPIGGGYGGAYFGLPPSAGPGYTLMGGANVINAFGQIYKDQEQARIMREQYYQAKLDTRKKKFDLEMYISANTPTPSEVQAKIAKQVLKRIQTNSNPAEIREGRSLNYLLNDIASKYHENKAPISEIPLDESVLKHLNITKGASESSLGLLRNGDKLIWPIALREMVPAAQLAEMGAQAQALGQNAIAGKEPDPNAIRDLRTQIDRLQEQLVKKANHFDTPDYTSAQRFLGDLLAATRAISSGGAAAQVEYQRLVSKGDVHNLNDLLKVMVSRGWRFGPALPSDEAAYRALHNALVSYDVALNQQVAATEP